MIAPPPAPALALAAALVAPAQPAADPLAELERAVRDLPPDAALFQLRSPEPPQTEIARLAAELHQLEMRLSRRLAGLDADPDLLTSPDLRQTRSDLAVRDLRLRIPIARARLVALDPAATSDMLARAADLLEPLGYAWGEPAADRRAALAALRFRAGDAAAALELIARASPADPLVSPLRTAARAALGRLDPLPLDPPRLRAAVAGAFRAPAGLGAAADLVARALRTSPPAALEPARRAALSALASLPLEPSLPPLAALARAAEAADRAALAELAQSPDDLVAAEARLALADLERPIAHLARAFERHPNPAARRLAAGRATASLGELPPDRRAPVARAFLAEFPNHPHADRWRLALAAAAPPDEALASLDRITDPDLAPPAAALAARRARDAFAAEPSRAAAEALLQRARAAESLAEPAWRPWLLRAEVEALLSLDRPAEAAERALANPAGLARPAAELLAPALLARARRAEAAADFIAQRDAALLAARLFDITGAAGRRALALALAGEPERALAALADAPETTPETATESATESAAASLARAEALFALERDAEAFPLYRQIAETAEAAGAHDDAFWRAWSRMLAIIARAEPARSPEITREIRRLRIIDAALGGEPHRRRLESLIKGPDQAD